VLLLGLSTHSHGLRPKGDLLSKACHHLLSCRTCGPCHNQRATSPTALGWNKQALAACPGPGELRGAGSSRAPFGTVVGWGGCCLSSCSLWTARSCGTTRPLWWTTSRNSWESRRSSTTPRRSGGEIVLGRTLSQPSAVLISNIWKNTSYLRRWDLPDRSQTGFPVLPYPCVSVSKKSNTDYTGGGGSL